LGRLATEVVREGGKKTAEEIISAADFDAQAWYEGNRRNGRFQSRTRMTIDTTRFELIRKSLHQRVGYLQSGWNAACQRFGVATPSWISGKNGRGTINVGRSKSKLEIRADNQISYAGGIEGMQRRLNFAAQLSVKRLERRSKSTAEKAMQEVIDK
jgi:hypothetical protein